METRTERCCYTSEKPPVKIPGNKLGACGEGVYKAVSFRGELVSDETDYYVVVICDEDGYNPTYLMFTESCELIHMNRAYLTATSLYVEVEANVIFDIQEKK